MLKKTFWPTKILYIPVVPILLALLSLLGVQQALVQKLLNLLHLPDSLNASSTALDPIQHIYRYSNQKPVNYIR